MLKPFLLIICIITTRYFCIGQHTNLEELKTVQDFINRSKTSNWDHALSKDGVTVKYRDLTLNDTIKTRQLKVNFSVITTLNKVLQHIKTPEHIESWNEFVKQEKLLKDDNSSWISHTIYAIPLPFTKQDLVAKHTLSKDTFKYIVNSKSTPEYIAEVDGLEREIYNVSYWIITQSENSIVDVQFSVITLSNAKIPRFIKDPIIQRKLLNSFIKLKEALASP